MAISLDRIGDVFIKVFVLALGLIFVIPMSYKIYVYAHKRTLSIATLGEVVSDPKIGSDLACRPQIVYSNHAGQTYEFKSKINFYWIFAPLKGDSLKVRYMKNAPEKAFVDSFYNYIVLPLQLLLIGAYIIYSVIFRRF
jgi:hypothetical protein